jgi:hypothetical protein
MPKTANRTPTRERTLSPSPPHHQGGTPANITEPPLAHHHTKGDTSRGGSAIDGHLAPP